MRLSRPPLILCLIAVLLLAAAAVVRFALVPSVSKLPDDLRSSQDYAGTYTGLNPEALSGTSTLTGVGTVGMTASRRYQASSTDGNTAVVVRILNRSVIGRAAPESRVTYAVDRSTSASTTAPPGSTGVVPSQGLIFALPLHPVAHASYRLWDETTAAAYPLTYQGTATVQHRSTMRYRSLAQGTVASPASLGLATSLPRELLIGLSDDLAGLLPAPLRSSLPAILAAQPDTVPLSWTSTTDSTIWADSTVGVPIRVRSTQQLSGAIAFGGQTLSVPFATQVLATTATSERRSAADASSAASTLTLVGRVVPLVLLGLGVALLVVAAVLAVRAGRRPGGTTPATPAPERTPTPV